MPERTPEPGDADQAEIRRLLRDARAEGPPPPEVVARLDETLASLVAERHGPRAAPPAHQPGATTSTAAPVDELAARRRRRRGVFAGVGVAAAAALIGAGFLTTVVLSDDDGPDSAGGQSSQVGERDAEDQQNDDAAPDEGAREPTEAPSAPDQEPPAQALPDQLPDDQEFAVDFTLDRLGVGREGYRAVLELSALDRANPSCAAAVETADNAVLVVVEGATQVLALDPRDNDGSREVRVLDCNVDPPALRTTVDVPAS